GTRDLHAGRNTLLRTGERQNAPSSVRQNRHPPNWNGTRVKIELNEITVREVAEGFLDNAEEGVVGYGGRLDIRPKYQREFVYDEKKRNAVIDTIRKGFPLNVMYWVVTDQETYEVMDGQQRTISFCQYVNGDFSIPFDGHPMAFHNLS